MWTVYRVYLPVILGIDIKSFTLDSLVSPWKADPDLVET